MKEINFVKLLVSLLLFLIISFLIVFFVLIPTVKEYKYVKKTFKNEKRLHHSISANNHEAQQLLSSLTKENKKEIASFDTAFDINDLNKHMETYFDTVAVEDVNNTSTNGPFIVHDISVAVYISSPLKFQEFVHSLEDYKNIVKVIFPIKFEKENKELRTEFMLKVFEYKQ